jgi:tetratricopeptide (TPR) repeat protein
MHRSALVTLALLLALQASPPARAAEGRDLAAEGQRLLDAGDLDGALKLLAKVSGKKPEEAKALLVRSTAHLLADEAEEGRRDLDRALELDPRLRQAWLNRAALDLAEQRYDPALEALLRAETLDAKAADNDLNIGAVLVLKGDLEAARKRFERYLAGPGGNAAGYYLVAMNYAGAGQAVLAVEQLKRAIALDERMRVRARGDANFVALDQEPAYRTLMSGEPQPPAADSYQAQRSFAVPYEGADGKLLPAVISALQLEGVRFEPQVEVTPRWALVFGDLRVVVRTGSDGQGLVEVSAAAAHMAANDFTERAESLFRRVQLRLAALKS